MNKEWTLEIAADACERIGNMFDPVRSVQEVAADSEGGNPYATVAIKLQCELTSSQAQIKEARELLLEPDRIDPAYRAKRLYWISRNQ